MMKKASKKGPSVKNRFA